MKFFLKLIKAKWIFKKPNKKKILIYDRFSEDYSRYLFSRKSCEILDVRYESINIYVFCVALLSLGIKNFVDNYKKIFIKLVSPKIVYSAIDSNPAFFKLKDIYDKPIYISDQNGMSRVEASFKQDEFYTTFKKYTQKTKKSPRADHIFLFGKNDKEKFSKTIKGNTYAFGNTKNNHYTIKSKKKKKITSIMFISTSKIEDSFPSNKYRRRFENDQMIFRHLTKFCKKQNIKLTFCSRYGASQEIFHRNNFVKGNWIYIPRINTHKTYTNLNKQQMVVSAFAGLGFQALAKGLKCANFYPFFPVKGSHLKYPKSGPFWTNSNSYYDFEKTLNRVISFSNERWKKIVKKYSTEILTYDSANIKKKKIIKMALKI